MFHTPGHSLGVEHFVHDMHHVQRFQLQRRNDENRFFGHLLKLQNTKHKIILNLNLNDIATTYCSEFESYTLTPFFRRNHFLALSVDCTRHNSNSSAVVLVVLGPNFHDKTPNLMSRTSISSILERMLLWCHNDYGKVVFLSCKFNHLLSDVINIKLNTTKARLRVVDISDFIAIRQTSSKSTQFPNEK